MHTETLELIHEMNPWLKKPESAILAINNLLPRKQTEFLLDKEWDKYCLVLLGPRQAGKTTLGKYLAQTLLQKKRYHEFLYLNCDFLPIREWLLSPLFVKQAFEYLSLQNPILFIDEIQRLENPGLLLKGMFDLQYKIKLIVSGSSYLELKSKVQEHLTGRNLEATILPLSYSEIPQYTIEQLVLGCYPAIVLHKKKEIILKKLYDDYISKDIIEILRVSKPDIMQKLLTLLAHISGQLVNYNQLATDCRVSIPTIQSYCNILEKTFIIKKITPFVGNKRKEIVSNPIYYFLDNGFRNQALRNLTLRDDRQDIGLLIENAVFQEIFKLKENCLSDINIHFWRTQSGAEVDFVLFRNTESILPIEVKYRNMKDGLVTKSLHSFLEAYQPKQAIVITKNYIDTKIIGGCEIKFIPFSHLDKFLKILQSFMT